LVINPELKQVIIFGIIGVWNTLLDFGVFLLLTWIFAIDPDQSVWMMVANTTSFTIAAINSYLLNKYYTFGSKKAASQKEFGLFFSVSLIGLLINNAILSIVLQAGASLSFSGALLPALGKLFATGGTMISNFLGYKFLVFKD
jgi:putative flippase GtrA